MKSPVSLEYVIAVALLAVSAAVLSYVTPQPVFNLAAILLGIYALHLVSVRIVVRQYAGAAPARSSRRARTTAVDREIQQMREELDLERRELDNRKAELQQRIVAAEQQWELLRQMIRDRVEKGGTLPDSVVANPEGALSSAASPGRTNGSDDPPRIHGRW
jgi:hypothetical protein